MNKISTLVGIRTTLTYQPKNRRALSDIQLHRPIFKYMNNTIYA